jgi:AI-2 transport protein TqsA
MNDSLQTERSASSPQSGSQSVPTWFLTLVTLVILLGLLWFGRGLLIPIVVATFLLILTMALIDRLDSVTIAGHSVPRRIARVLSIVFMVLAVLGLGSLVSNQAAAISEAAPRYAERIADLKIQIDSFLGPDRVASLQRAIAEADVNSLLADFAASAGGAIGNVVLILLYFAFMLAERGAFFAKIPRLCATDDGAQRLTDSMESISVGVQQYVWINTLTSGMSSILAFVVLKVVGVDFAVVLALLVFLLSFIPTLGSFLCLVTLVLAALLQFDTVTPALIVAVVYGGGDAIIGNIVQPKLQGKSLNMSSLMVMVALAFWGMMWGGVGAFMAVPLTVVIMIVCSQVPALRAFAILLSSDGVLPGDDAGEEVSAGTEEATLPGKPLPQTEDAAV